MNYADALFRDKNAQCALDIAWKYNLTDQQMHTLAWYLHKEEANGRIKHDEHRKQVAAKWAKAR